MYARFAAVPLTVLLAFALATATAAAPSSGPRIVQQDSPWTIFDTNAREQWKIKRYGIEDGLPSLYIHGLEHGSDGRLWIGSSGGLVTFDGVQFHTPADRYIVRDGETSRAAPFSTDFSTEDLDDSIYSEYVTALLPQDGGRMWVGTDFGALRCYIGSECEVMEIRESMTSIRHLASTGDGAIWAGGIGLLRVTPSGVDVIFDAQGSNTPLIKSLASDPLADDAIWITTEVGLFRWDEASGLVEVDTRTTRGVLFDQSGRQWRFSDSTIEVGEHSAPWQVARYSSRLSKSIHIDEERTLAILDGECLICDYNGGEIKIAQMNDPRSTQAAARGPDGSIWIASLTEGLQFVERTGFVPISTPSKNQTYFTVEPTPEGSVALASSSVFGLLIARPTRGNLSGKPLEPIQWKNESPATHATPTFSAVMESEEVGWLSTPAGTLHLRDGRLNLVGPGSDRAYRAGRLCRMPSENVWTRMDQKIVEIAGGTLTGRQFDLPGTILTKLIPDGEDLLAFQDERLVRFSTGTMTSEVILEFPGSVYGSVFKQRSGDLWISTDGDGLYRQRTTGQVDHWTTQHGLPSRFIGSVCTVPGPTEATHLWVNSNAGVQAITFDSLEETANGQQDLLRFHMFYTGESLGASNAALDSGVLALPTARGPIAIDTHAPLPANEPPRLSTATIWANGAKLEDGNHLRGHTDLEFEFCAAQFPVRQTSLVQFRLEGHDTEWQNAGRNRQARYTSLPPGDYQLHLRARAAGSDFGPTVVGPALLVSPLWHQRLTVRIGCIAALMALSLLFFQGRTRRLRRHSGALEAEIARREDAETDLGKLRRQLARAEEAERSRIARELHDDFSQRLAALSLSLQLSGEALEPAIDPEQHARLLDAQSGIERLASDVHALSRQLHPAVLDDLGLSAALRSECKMRGDRTAANLSLDDDGTCANVRGEVGLAFFRVAQEALQNAAKHSRAESISLTLRRSDSDIELCISDNGNGFDPGSTTDGGLGLSSMRERMGLVGGELSVRSTISEGTKICARAPDPAN